MVSHILFGVVNYVHDIVFAHMACDLALRDAQNMCTLSKVGTVLKAAAGSHSDL